MKLVKNKNNNTVSLSGRITIQPNDESLIHQVCIAEGWDKKDCELIEVPKGMESDILEADTIEFAGGGLVCSKQGTTNKDEYNQKVQAVKQKYPEVYDLLSHLGMVTE